MPIKMLTKAPSIDQVKAVIRNAKREAVMEIGLFVVRRAATYPPKRPSIFRYVRTGTLGKSIAVGEIVEGENQVSLEVGTSIKYAKWVEEGTGIYGPTGQVIRAKGKAFPLPLAAGIDVANMRGVRQTASGISKRKGKMTANTANNRYILFRRTIKGMPGWHYMKNAFAATETKDYFKFRVEQMAYQIEVEITALGKAGAT